MKLENNYKEKTRRTTNTWGLNMSLNNYREEIKKYLQTNVSRNATYQNLRRSKSRSKRKVHNNTGLSQETREISTKQFNFTLKKLEKEQSPKLA